MALKVSDIRAYLKARVLECLPDALEIDDPFGSRDVMASEIKHGFKIWFGETTTESRAGGDYLDTIPATVQIYLQDAGKATDLYDQVYDSAHEIKDNILDPTKCNTSLAFTSMLGNSILVAAMNTNDRGFEATINVTCIRYADYINT